MLAEQRIGPYAMNLRFQPEILRPEQIAGVERIASFLSPTLVRSPFIRIDMEPVTEWDPRRRWPGEFRIYEVEPDPSVVIPFGIATHYGAGYAQRFLDAVRGIGAQGLYCALPQDLELYRDFAERLGIGDKVYAAPEEVPVGTRIFGSLNPKMVPEKDKIHWEWVSDPLVPKSRSTLFLSGGEVVFWSTKAQGFKEGGLTAQELMSHGRILQLMEKVSGFVLKPDLGSMSDDVLMRGRLVGSGAATWTEITSLLESSIPAKRNLILQPFFPGRRGGPEGKLNEIHRLYFLHDGDKFRFVLGGGVARSTAKVHGASDAEGWLVA